jgi:ATP-dependent Clp protease ATP-binding subunit ClpB
MAKLLADKRLSLEVSEAAKGFLADKGYDPVYGARPLKRAIQRHLQDPLALRVLQGDFAPGSTIHIDVSAGSLSMKAQAMA